MNRWISSSRRRPSSCPVSQGSQGAFPVHRIYCVGRNYAAHAIEMGGDPIVTHRSFSGDREASSWTADTSLTPTNPTTFITRSSSSSRSGRTARKIPLDEALDCICGYGVGLDMTRRDLQGRVQETGGLGNGQSLRAPRPPLGAGSGGRDRSSLAGAVRLDVNMGRAAKTGDLNQMIWKVPEIIS